MVNDLERLEPDSNSRDENPYAPSLVERPSAKLGKSAIDIPSVAVTITNMCAVIWVVLYIYLVLFMFNFPFQFLPSARNLGDHHEFVTVLYWILMIVPFLGVAMGAVAWWKGHGRIRWFAAIPCILNGSVSAFILWKFLWRFTTGAL